MLMNNAFRNWCFRVNDFVVRSPFFVLPLATGRACMAQTVYATQGTFLWTCIHYVLFLAIVVVGEYVSSTI